MNLYIADTHFGHANILKYDHRPFGSVDEMDAYLIERWKDRVQKDDHVWFLGDFAMKHAGDHPAQWYLRQLPGHKHLVIGNHDGELLRNKTAMSYFETADQIREIKDTFEGKAIDVILCHYPFAEWNKMFHGSWHVYGHIHNSKNDAFEIMKNIPRALNAGCMINGYAPVSFKELVENNMIFLGKEK